MKRLDDLATALIFFLLAWNYGHVTAQSAINFPRCNDTGLQWASNSEGQNPCQVAAILQGSCFGGTWNIPPISPGRLYGGPSSLETSNVCQCNTVVYSLVAACSACQDGPFSTWTAWKTNCTSQDITVAEFPLAIPRNTSVPSWAYVNVTARGNTWDQDAAHANADSNSPETTGGSEPPKSISKPLTSTNTVASTGSPSPTANANKGGSNSKAGPIAGGVVGGVVGLVCLVLLAFVLYRKSYRPKEAVQRVNEKVDIGGVATPAPTQGGEHTRSPSGGSNGEQHKLYNPSDPSTFPPSPFPNYPTHTQNNPYGPLGRVAARSGASGYSGIPEV